VTQGGLERVEAGDHDVSDTAHMEGTGQMWAKAAAFVCLVIAAGLLVASVFVPGPARAGMKSQDLRHAGLTHPTAAGLQHRGL
jgi:hypothetical protein